MNRSHVVLQTPSDLDYIVATIESVFKPQAGDFVEGLEMGHVDKRVSGIIKEVIEAEE